MFRADLFGAHAVGLLGGERKHALRLVGKWQIDAGRDLFAQRGVLLNLLSDRHHRRMGAQEPAGQRLVFPKNSQQKVFGFNETRAELAGLIPAKKDYPPCSFGISFEHSLAPCPKSLLRRDYSSGRRYIAG